MDPQDYLLNENYQMYFDPATGDWAFGGTNEIDVDLIFNTPMGQWGQSLLTGVGMLNYLNMDVDKTKLTYLEKTCNQQLKAANFSNPDTKALLSNGGLLGVSADSTRSI